MGEHRTAIGRNFAAAIAILLVVGAVALGIASEPNTRASTVASTSSVQVVARAIDVDGNPVTNVSLKLGQELLLSVSVPTSSTPVRVHQVFRNHTYGDLPWNVTATHYTYVIDSGPADTADLGVNQVYAVVTFADGSVARSNNVTMTVTG